jgi:hypothetical protein
LKSIDFPYPVEPIVRHHHEQWDGRGYPKGLRGQEIPVGARILAVVDCYDALTSDRPYRPRLTRQQAEQVLRERRGRAYDPWVVDQFLSILDRLDAAEAAEERKVLMGSGSVSANFVPAQLDAISATTAEEREFNELRRDLPRAGSLDASAEVLFRHVRRIVPASVLALYAPTGDSNELSVVSSAGAGTSLIEGLRVQVGDRISGWVFAHSQPVINSDATLEIGPVARTLPSPLRYAAAVPVIDGGTVAVLMVLGNEPFEKDHRRVLENVATLFVASAGQSFPTVTTQSTTPHPETTFKQRIH